MINTVIIEDNTDFRNGIKLLLKTLEGFDCIADFEDAEAGVDFILKNDVDLVLMDIDLPKMNGIAATALIKKSKQDINIVIITVFESSAKVFEALCNGAVGYITKNSSIQNIGLSLKEVINGGSPMSSNIARMVVESFQRNFQSPLSDRETEVLQSLSEGKSYTVIADEIFVSKETVKSHIKQIYKKLEVHSKKDAIAKAKENNLLN